MGCKNSLRIAANNVRIQLFDVGVDDFLLLSISFILLFVPHKILLGKLYVSKK